MLEPKDEDPKTHEEENIREMRRLSDQFGINGVPRLVELAMQKGMQEHKEPLRAREEGAGDEGGEAGADVSAGALGRHGARLVQRPSVAGGHCEYVHFGGWILYDCS